MVNKYQNLEKVIELSEDSWRAATDDRLVDLAVRHVEAPYLEHDGLRFINMCSCSYLGWDRHPEILEGAVRGIREAGTLHLTTARCRLFISLLGEYEAALAQHFDAHAVAYNSCAAASSAALPLLASGALTEKQKPVMAFDKFAHFSLAHMKALCADETDVVTIQNNDIDALEELCRSNARVAYVSDATYSIKGFADFNNIQRLQRQYGMFVYLDDSHGLSVYGRRGRGHALEVFNKLNEETIVVASLAKAFGAAGGVLLSGNPNIRTLLARYGNAWSQYLNSAGIGGGLASIELHKGEHLTRAQDQWAQNLGILDWHFRTINADTKSPIRVIQLKSPQAAVRAAKQLMNEGYYTSAVFFPVVPKNSAGIRIMPRADIPRETMIHFCQTLGQVCGEDIVPAKIGGL